MFSISNLQKHIEYQDAVIAELSLRVIEAEEQTTVAVQHCDYVVKAVIEKEW